MRNAVYLIWRRMVAWFLAGLLTIMPLVLTIGIIIWVASFLERFVGPDTVLGNALESLGLNFAENTTVAYAIGFLFVLGTIFLLGMIFELGAKRYFQKLIDALLKRIPLVGSGSTRMNRQFARSGSSSDTRFAAQKQRLPESGKPSWNYSPERESEI